MGRIKDIAQEETGATSGHSARKLAASADVTSGRSEHVCAKSHIQHLPEDGPAFCHLSEKVCRQTTPDSLQVSCCMLVLVIAWRMPNDVEWVLDESLAKKTFHKSRHRALVMPVLQK